MYRQIPFGSGCHPVLLVAKFPVSLGLTSHFNDISRLGRKRDIPQLQPSEQDLVPVSEFYPRLFWASHSTAYSDKWSDARRGRCLLSHARTPFQQPPPPTALNLLTSPLLSSALSLTQPAAISALPTASDITLEALASQNIQIQTTGYCTAFLCHSRPSQLSLRC